VREYYEALRELMSAIALMDGFTVKGEGAHLALISYFERTYSQMSVDDIALLKRLHDLRNQVSYDGKFVSPGFLLRNEEHIAALFDRLEGMAQGKTT
jgi:hypothetical protein